jgi:diguanylate cyclase (GGDEF)-like protein
MGGSRAFSNLLRARDGRRVVAIATPVEDRHTRRVVVELLRSTDLEVVLDYSTIARIASDSLTTSRRIDAPPVFLLDANGRVLASSQTSPLDATGRVVAYPKRIPHDRALPDRDLAAALAHHRTGSFGDRYYATASVSQTGWRIVSTTSRAALVAPVEGSTQLTAWLLFGALVAAVLSLLALGARLATTNSNLAGAVAEIEELARTDALTGLPNRRMWDEELTREFARAGRSGRPLSIAMIDLDHFKAVNDTHGHEAGDTLLRDAGAAWRAALRQTDVVTRFGGDEFAVLMPDCALAQATAVLQRARDATPHGQTCSTGVACWDGAESSQELMARADAALYEAKRYRPATPDLTAASLLLRGILGVAPT